MTAKFLSEQGLLRGDFCAIRCRFSQIAPAFDRTLNLFEPGDKVCSYLPHQLKHFTTLWIIKWGLRACGDFGRKQFGWYFDLTVCLFVQSQVEFHEIDKKFSLKPRKVDFRVLVDLWRLAC